MLGVRPARYYPGRRQPGGQRHRRDPLDRRIPVAAFGFLTAAMAVSVSLILASRRPKYRARSQWQPPHDSEEGRSVDQWKVSGQCAGIRTRWSASCRASGIDVVVRYDPRLVPNPIETSDLTASSAALRMR